MFPYGRNCLVGILTLQFPRECKNTHALPNTYLLYSTYAVVLGSEQNPNGVNLMVDHTYYVHRYAHHKGICMVRGGQVCDISLFLEFGKTKHTTVISVKFYT